MYIIIMISWTCTVHKIMIHFITILNPIVSNISIKLTHIVHSNCGLSYTCICLCICMYMYMNTVDILRRFENTIESIIPQLPTTFDDVTDSDGKAALIWILGEYGEVSFSLSLSLSLSLSIFLIPLSFVFILSLLSASHLFSSFLFIHAHYS